MNFNTLVKTRIYPTLEQYGFEIVLESKDVIRFQSSKALLNIVFNELEKSYLVEMGKQKSELLLPLNDKVVQAMSGLPLSIEKVPLEEFVDNLCIFFKTPEGIRVLGGHLDKFVQFKIEEIRNYNVELLRSQELGEASKAWEANDYDKFIQIIKNVGVENVSRGVKLKYEKAKNLI